MKGIKTYQELEEHLLAVMDNFNDDDPCQLNRNIPKVKYWNMLMRLCIGEDGLKNVNEVIIKNTLAEFPEHLRYDFGIES